MKKDSKDVHVTNTVFFYKSGRTFYSRSSFREASGKPSGYYEAGIQGQLDSTWAQKPGTKTLLSFLFYLSTLPGFFFFFLSKTKKNHCLAQPNSTAILLFWTWKASLGNITRGRQFGRWWWRETPLFLAAPFIWITPGQNSNSIFEHSRAVVRQVGCLLKYHPLVCQGQRIWDGRCRIQPP